MQDILTAEFYRKLQLLKMRTRKAFVGQRQGSHRSLRKGHGLEFSDYRPYSPGDDFRHIDWGVMARTDKAYVRQYREEQDISVLFIADSSSSMFHPESKFKRISEIILALSVISLSDGDNVRVHAIGGKSSQKINGIRKTSIISKFLQEIEPSNPESYKNSLKQITARSSLPGKCFFLSDFMLPLDELFSALDILRSTNYEVCLLHVLSNTELELDLGLRGMVVDSEKEEQYELRIDEGSKKEYKQLLNKHLAAIELYAKKNSMAYHRFSSEKNVEDIVIKELPKIGVLK